jgi:hypothetical protein
MKKLLIVLAVATGVLTGTLEFAFAGAATGGATEPTQILNNLQLIPTNISTSLDAANTTILSTKALLGPVINNMIALTQAQTAKGILNLINSGNQGDSLVLSDPRDYIDKQGLNVVKIGLGALAGQSGGAYTDSLLKTLTVNFKTPNLSGLGDQLKSINQSPVPSIIQEKACDDTMLTNLATEDITADGSPFDAAKFKERKQYFYEQFCKNSASDPQTARALATLDQARPALGGWDKWLATTVEGKNPYNAAVQSGELIAEQANTAKQDAASQVTSSGGVVSQTDCTLRAPTNTNGEAFTDPKLAPCIIKSVVNPSGLIKDSLSQASLAGFSRLSNIQGADTLFGILGDIGTLVQGVSGVRNAIGSITGGGSTGNVSNSTQTSAAPQNDLVNKPAEKSQVTGSFSDLLNTNAKTLDTLESTDNQIIALMKNYSARVKFAKSCFSNDSVVRDREGKIDTINAKLTADQEGISQERSLITSTQSTISTSQSTNEILAAFNTYQDQIRNLPNPSTLAERKQDLFQAQSQVNNDDNLSRLERQCENQNSAPQGF